MNSEMRKLQVLLALVALSAACGFAQKVKVGFDKGADFSKYKSYTLRQPPTTPSRPILYESVVGSIKKELEAKGLTSVERDGDLTLIPTGGVGYGLEAPPGLLSDTCKNCQAPAVDVQLWAGFKPPPGSSGKPLPEGTLELDFVDRASNKVVWSGTVIQKLNPEKREQSMDKIPPAINKLLAEFPPKK